MPIHFPAPPRTAAAWRIRFTLACLLPAAMAWGGISELAPAVRTRICVAANGEEVAEVCGVHGERVHVRRADGLMAWLQAPELTLRDRITAPIGRVTIFAGTTPGSSDGLASRLLLDGDRQTFPFELVADRALPAVYAVLVVRHPDGPGESVRLAELGDLPAGERVRRVAQLREPIPPGSEGTVMFFADGHPIETYDFSTVALNPASRSLLVPWADRLAHFAEISRRTGRSCPASPFALEFSHLDREAMQSRGVFVLQVELSVRTDGSVELTSEVPTLTAAERSGLRQDIADWRFFPAVESGTLVTATIQMPVVL